jgi:hypothetical protein
MKVNKEQFEAVVHKLLTQPATKRESLKTGETKKTGTIIPPRPQPDQQ